MRVHFQLAPESALARELLCTELAAHSNLSFGPPAPEEFEGLVAGRPEPALLSGEQLRALVIPFAGIPPAITAERLSEHPTLAVYDALRAGALFGAGLDVWWRYPESRDLWGQTLPAELPFHELENTVLSPHRAGHVLDNEERRAVGLVEVLRALCAGREPGSRVDLSQGY